MRHNDLWDVVHRLVYCPIAKVQNWISRNKQCIEHLLLQVYEFSLWKVASTSWFGNFLSMAGVELSQLPHVLDLIPGLNRLPTYQNAHDGRFDQYFQPNLSQEWPQQVAYSPKWFEGYFQPSSSQECRGELGGRVRGSGHKSSHKVQQFKLRNSASSFHWLSSSIFNVRSFVVPHR